MVVSMQKIKKKPGYFAVTVIRAKGHMGTLDLYLLHNRHFKKETRVRCLLLWLVQYD